MSDEGVIEPDDVEESVDLFGFDELRASTSAGASAPAGRGAGVGSGPGFDEDDDLFGFDDLTAEPEPMDVEVDVAEILADAEADEPRNDSPVAPAAPTPTVVRRPRRAAAPARPVARRARAGAAPVRSSARSVTTWVLLGFTAINLGLIGLTFQISESMKQEMGEAARNIVRITSEIQTQTGRHVERIESVQRPVVAVDPSQHKTFELVRRELETGEYETARLRLYSLLAVADRLDGEVRSDVEARAQYMLADIALAQALAASDAGKSGEGLP